MEIRIGDLAKRSGCEVVTIRYYEKEGLLPKPARSGGNFRLYGEAHIERLQFIRHCRSLDMTLSEIRALLGLRDNPMQDCGEVNTLLEAHIGVLSRNRRNFRHPSSSPATSSSRSIILPSLWKV